MSTTDMLMDVGLCFLQAAEPEPWSPTKLQSHDSIEHQHADRTTEPRVLFPADISKPQWNTPGASQKMGDGIVPARFEPIIRDEAATL